MVENLQITATCPTCENAIEYSSTAYTLVGDVLERYHWICHNEIWYCDRDCIPTDYDPREEALTAGERTDASKL